MTPWYRTQAAATLGIDYPIVQGPFGGGLSSTALVAAVSNLGGLGSFGAQGLAPARIREIVADIRQWTARPFAMNLWVSTEDPGASAVTAEAFEAALSPLRPLYAELGVEPPRYAPPSRERFEDQVEALLDLRVPAFSFVFGVPDPTVLEACREQLAHGPRPLPYPVPSELLAPLRAAALARDRVDLVSLWAGQAAPLVRHRRARDLFAALVEDTTAILARDARQ